MGIGEAVPMTAKYWSWAELTEGTRAEFVHTVQETDVAQFARLSGDGNPLHTDRDYAQRAGFRDRVVHGAFLAALVSRLVGMELPGRNALLLSLELKFAAPTYADDELRVGGVILSVHEAQRALVLRIEIRCGDEVRASGKALVRVAPDV